MKGTRYTNEKKKNINPMSIQQPKRKEKIRKGVLVCLLGFRYFATCRDFREVKFRPKGSM